MDVSQRPGSSQQNVREPKRGNRMIDHVGCRMKVITLDGRTYSGVLKAFDKFMNLILDECKLIDVPEDTSAQTETTPGASGFVLMRGEQIVAMCVLEPRPPSQQEKYQSRPREERDPRPRENRSRSFPQDYQYDDGRSRGRTHQSPGGVPSYRSLGSPSPRAGQSYRSPSPRDGPNYRLGSPSPIGGHSYRNLGSPSPRGSQSYRGLGSPSSYYSGSQDSHMYEDRGSRRGSREMEYERSRDRGYIHQERDYSRYDRHGYGRDYGRSRDYDYYSGGRRY